MPLPWLIGAAVVAAGAAVVAALSDEDKSSNSNNNDDEDRRRRVAEHERKERERNEKKISIKQEFDQGVQKTYQEIITLLPNWVTIHGTMINNLTLSSNGSNFTQLESGLEKATKYQFVKDISLFEQVYGVNVKPTEEMKSTIKNVDLLQDEVNQLTLAIKALS
ncbi:MULTISPECIES: hypothetical protein [Acinetobacter]|uniref:hypothetical protein n=1 Tax=Acinetobacter TaxID=469 RepID=UPI0022E5D0F1|nr:MULTISPECIES: hypothetical protein [Acinetobacter]MDI1223029.1 hypothetical protein [Acinetobacter sp.]